jgi:hypothetical protein
MQKPAFAKEQKSFLRNGSMVCHTEDITPDSVRGQEQKNTNNKNIRILMIKNIERVSVVNKRDPHKRTPAQAQVFSCAGKPLICPPSSFCCSDRRCTTPRANAPFPAARSGRFRALARAVVRLPQHTSKRANLLYCT